MSDLYNQQAKKLNKLARNVDSLEALTWTWQLSVHHTLMDSEAKVAVQNSYIATS